MAQMDEHMQMMKALHEKMMSATTPEARQIVMDKQREEMQAVHGHDESDDARRRHDGEHGRRDDGAEGQTSRRGSAQMQMMQKRMDMMEMMMQTMMDQQGMMAGPKSLDATPRK